MEPMENCFTLVYINNNLNNPSERIINVYQLMDEIDAGLDDIFKDTEQEVPSSLVAKTIASIKKEL